MPTYEYECSDCGEHFEEIQKISEEPIKKCPKCQKDNVHRIISATAFHLKGSGWYKTDYASSGSKPSTAPANSSNNTNTSPSTPTNNAEGSTSSPSTTNTPPAKKEPSGGCGGGNSGGH